jgi:hypothetical protein
MASATANSKPHPQVHDLLMLYRPISQLLRIFVEPDLDARLHDGRLRPDELPLQLHLLRVVWQLRYLLAELLAILGAPQPGYSRFRRTIRASMAGGSIL